MWSDSSRTEHHPIKFNQRPHLTRRRTHLSKINRRPPISRLESQADPTDTWPSFWEQLLQLVELQQVTPMAASGLWQGHVRRRRPCRHKKHRPLVHLPTDERGMEQHTHFQLRAHDSRTFCMHVPHPDGHYAAVEIIQRQRPRVPQRHVPLVAPPPQKGESSQVFRMESWSWT